MNSRTPGRTAGPSVPCCLLRSLCCTLIHSWPCCASICRKVVSHVCTGINGCNSIPQSCDYALLHSALPNFAGDEYDLLMRGEQASVGRTSAGHLHRKTTEWWNTPARRTQGFADLLTQNHIARGKVASILRQPSSIVQLGDLVTFLDLVGLRVEGDPAPFSLNPVQFKRLQEGQRCDLRDYGAILLTTARGFVGFQSLTNRLACAS